jgi:SAM-dependent methyltransferase
MQEVLTKDDRVDVERAGVIGRSYGGYMTLTLAGRHPELWRAAVDMFGPYDLITFVDRIPETWKPYFSLVLGDPQRDRDFLVERSPKTHIRNIESPLLVIQGANDPRVVEREYASDQGLRGRHTAYDEYFLGDDPRDVALTAVAEASPRRVVEVGCGWGWFSARVARELDAQVVAVDISPRMVELAREQGVDARVGDVQDLPFDDGEFDCAVANWMLYHVPDLDRALAELARVVRPGGRLVAATSSLGHLHELWKLVGRDRYTENLPFQAERAEESLQPFFSRIERRDVRGTLAFPDADAVRRYIGASISHKHLAERVPELTGPFEASVVTAVFVAEKA